jgi:uroporphyrinogen-III synthase
MSKKKELLSTIMLDQSLINRAMEKGIELDALSFIRVSSNVEDDLHAEMEELCDLPLTAIFTSVNAVRAIGHIIKSAMPAWSIYCISEATKKTLLEYFDTAAIKGTANDAAKLAELMIANDVLEAVFFCGDKRTGILPLALRDHDITVHEVIVYQTTETPHQVSKKYDGILFFSPSAVKSFFSMNKTGAETVLFAIGNTTADALKEHTDNTVIIGNIPSKEQLLDISIEYLQTHIKGEHK